MIWQSMMMIIAHGQKGEKMTDYISREAAIEAIENTDWYHINHSGELVHGANSNDDTPLYKADDVYKAIDAVPAADVVERKPCEWLHDLLQDAIDAGIITEVQAVRIMERVKA